MIPWKNWKTIGQNGSSRNEKNTADEKRGTGNATCAFPVPLCAIVCSVSFH
ncbi:hypothetical protein HMPREF7215_0689 [Pyramidobacter piscolens W5455]|uniref:Uncharacterized protein n=1 Tax=Pyramidobacter piscolens W5455 TaxID=352165 RepID=A0ABM9ZW16_9BACT|nr:hypothetical protein HMPREF7215_0689 [Pyramidobacter piscolens W5455]